MSRAAVIQRGGAEHESSSIAELAAKLRFPPVLLRYWISICALTAVSLTFTLSATFLFKQHYPYGLPLFHADVPFWDFWVFKDRFLHFQTPLFWNSWDYPFTYPAPAGLAFAFFYEFPRPVLFYILVISGTLLIGVWLLQRALRARGAALLPSLVFSLTVLLTCWPVGYLLNRANIEGVVGLLTAAGILAVVRQRWWLAATLIGLAGSMKLFPFVMLGLLISKRRYKETAFAFLVAAVVSMASLRILGPSMGEAQRQISLGLLFFEHNWAEKVLPGEIGFDHSLFTLMKLPLFVADRMVQYVKHGPGGWHFDLDGPQIRKGVPEQLLLERALRVYMVLVGGIGIVLYFLRIRTLPMLNQIVALSVCAVLLPPVSFDYTLVHLLAPFGLLCLYATDAWRQGREPDGLRVCLGFLAFIFSMDAFLTVHFRLAGQARAVALLVLLLAVLRHRFRWDEADGAEGPVVSVA